MNKIRNIISEYFFDLFFYLFLLIYCFISFYSKWNLWEDQANHAYISWGLLHGMVPYVDLIDINYPGKILVHLIPWFISDSYAFGLRLIDIVFLFILCISSSVILSRFSVHWTLRITCLTIFLASYFFTGFQQTAQKDLFSLSLVIFGLLPWFTNKFNKLVWIIFGGICAFGLWIKPTPIVVVLFVLFYFYFEKIEDRSTFFKKLQIYIFGGFLISFFILLWLYLVGGLFGFIKWSFALTLGSYQWSKEPWLARLIDTAHYLRDYYLPLLLVIFGIISIIFTRRKFFQSRYNELLFVLLLTLVCLFIPFFQGKTYCTYHFIPLQWSLVMLASVLISCSFVAELLNKFRFIWLVCVIVASLNVFSGKLFPPSHDTCGAALAKSLKSNIELDRTVVTFGFIPTFHAEFKRKTPFPFTADFSTYRCCAPMSYERKEILSALELALGNPSVKLFIITNEAKSILLRDGFQIKKIYELGYRYEDSNLPCSPWFSFYWRK